MNTSKSLFIAIVTSLTLLLSSTAFSATSADENVMVTINGAALTKQEFQAFVKMRLNKQQQAKLSPKQIQALMVEFINRELIFQDAVKKKIDQQPQIMAEIENQRRNIVSTHSISQLLRSQPSDAEMKKIYKEKLSRPSNEYKARHILVKTEQEAKQIIAALNKGDNFEKLAKTKSLDSSAKDGGDLGWFKLNRMVRPFAMAVARLKPNNFTTTPVKTRFGWHIIKLEGLRETPPPAFEAVKPRIIQLIKNQRVAAHVATLRKQANIKVNSKKKAKISKSD